MICPKCGSSNNEGTNFCVKCGNPLGSNNVVQPNVQHNVVASKESVNYFFFILAIILKPMTFFKEELKRFEELKFSAIFSIIIAGIATILTLICTMITSVIVKSYDWLSGATTTTWAWDNLKNIDYVNIIGKNFILYLVVLFVIAGVYFLASLVAKKQLNFSRLLGVTSSSVIVYVIAAMLIAPILGSFYTPLGIIITAVGAVYTLLILIEGMNNELMFDNKDMKVQFNFICLSIIFIIAYIALMQLLSSILGVSASPLDMFK